MELGYCTAIKDKSPVNIDHYLVNGFLLRIVQQLLLVVDHCLNRVFPPLFREIGQNVPDYVDFDLVKKEPFEGLLKELLAVLIAVDLLLKYLLNLDVEHVVRLNVNHTQLGWVMFLEALIQKLPLGQTDLVQLLDEVGLEIDQVRVERWVWVVYQTSYFLQSAVVFLLDGLGQLL